MKKSIRVSVALLAGLAMLLLAGSLVGCKKGAGKTLYLYNWTYYTPDSVIEKFEKEYGVKVVYDDYASNEDMYAKLKAGGSGLNLTGADTVIHFDPWWNPAVEDQATDRAHRIGQTRVVTAYRLIARGTIEEKIMALSAKKRELVSNVLGAEENTVPKGLTRSDVEMLLADETGAAAAPEA